ncbi:MAG: hypothetical protein WC966_01095 [Bradymonadales bacterium]
MTETWKLFNRVFYMYLPTLQSKRTTIAAILCILFTVSALNACSSAPQEEEATEIQVEESPAVDAAKFYGLPTKPGVFMHTQQGLVELQRGAPEALQISNAERGFGFMRPSGDQYSFAATDWYVWTKTLNAGSAQLTSMRGVAILPERWYDLSAEGNIAWIPSESLQTTFEKVTQGENSVIRLSIDEPLKPGFYVLHDQSFLQGVKKSDVTAYYPFVIQEKSGKNPWIDRANACFRNQFEKLQTIYEISTPLPQNTAKLRQCAIEHQLASVLATDKQNEQLFMQRIILARLANDDSSALRTLIYQEMNASGDDLEQWLWWRAQSDVLLELSALHNNNELAAKLRENNLRCKLCTFYSSDLSPQSQNIRALMWLPFFLVNDATSLEPSTLDSYFAQLQRGELPIRPLILWLGAQQLKKMRDFADKNKSFAHRFQYINTKTPQAFRDAASQVKLKIDTKAPVLGPFLYSNVQNDDEKREFTQKILRNRQGIESCVSAMQRRQHKNTGVFVITLPLTSQLFGREVLPSISNPLSDSPADAEFSQCCKRALAPVLVQQRPEPVDETDVDFGTVVLPKSVTFGISYNSDTSAIWLQ